MSPSEQRNPEFIAEALSQLQRILKSTQFSRSAQASKLLSFLVDEGMSASGSRGALKEYSIGLRFFGRPESYDPATDNIVRVEVRRIRLKLQAYYAEEGAADPIEVMIPKGGYTPVFRRRDISDLDLTGRTVGRYKFLGRRYLSQWCVTYDANRLDSNSGALVIVPTKLGLESQDRVRILPKTSSTNIPSHPNIATIQDVDEKDGSFIIGLEPLRGKSLKQYAEQGRLGNNAMSFARQFASALASGHAIGQLHGNLYPECVFVEQGDAETDPILRILPFGMFPLVALKDDDFRHYRPPEWNEGHDPNPRSDVWSFGALVWLACFGEAPPGGIEEAVGATESRAGITPLETALKRCLRRNPQLRYANAVEILKDLDRSSQPQPKPMDVQPHIPMPSIHRDTIAVTAFLLTVLIVVCLLIVYFRS